MKSRLNRARGLLQRQLTRRGIHLASLLAALSVAESASRASMPATLAHVTVQSGLLVAAGNSAAGVIPTHIAALAAGVTRAMFLTKAKIAVAVLFAVSVVTGAGVLTHQALAGRPVAPQASTPKPPQKTKVTARSRDRATTATPLADDKDSIRYSGRVLDPDGRPISGAKVYLTRSWRYVERPAEATVHATTSDNGKFRFSVPNALIAKEHLEELVATAEGFGPAWTDLKSRNKREDVTLHLVKDLPIIGQIVDLQGKAVQGAIVRVLDIKATVGEDLGPWFQDVNAKNGLSLQLESRHFKRELPCPEFPSLPRQTATDAEGRFRIDGIGRERLLLLRIDGPAIATGRLAIFTRQNDVVRVRHRNAEPEYGVPADTATYYGTTFRYVATPSKPIIGVIRDRDTKKPLAGVIIRRSDGELLPNRFLQTKSDELGRYRLDGMSKGNGNQIIARPTDDQPYLMVHADVPDTPGFEPVTVDFDLKRGVWIEGKITDKATGKPVQGQVEYFAFRGNRSLGDHPGYMGTYTGLFQNRPVLIGKDGSYRVVGLPGPGVLLVTSFEDYLRATEREDAEGTKEEFLPTEPYGVLPINYHAVARIDPPSDAKKVSRDVTLDPGETLTGTVIGADGKPLSGTRAYGLLASAGWSPLLENAVVMVRGYNRHRPRFILFVHPEKKLTGILVPPKNKTDPVTIAMQPAASVTGRLVNEESQPRPGLTLQVTFRQPLSDSWISPVPNEITTDNDGQFRLDSLFPGCRVELRDSKGSVEFDAGAKPGDTKDVKDVKTKPAGE